MRRPLKLIGLTGGIGSGKSTVAGLIGARGVPVIDADGLAREVVAPGQPALADIAAAWPQMIAADGTLDRKRLGALVFADPVARHQLEAITHPRIKALAAARIEALAQQGHKLAFYEASLLVESGQYRDYDGLVVVRASVENQLRRARARDGFTEVEAGARIAAQLPLEEKLRFATAVIDNDGDPDATRAQVNALVDQLLR
ncbi:MAG TPA: dephospho-CoA kinase [Polyangia bacterium]|nr:dephospho-CoA kinase [Polyangia bacterium]